jgi:hypothetical protein
MTKIFKVEIDLSNSAFAGAAVYEELPRILEKLALDVSGSPMMPLTLRDINGNKVGTAWIDAHREEMYLDAPSD